MASESEEYEYAYSSDEDGYPMEEEDDDDGDNNPGNDGEHGSAAALEWNSSENPNAAPSSFKHSTGSGTPAASSARLKSGIRMMNADELRPEMTRRLKDVSEVLGVSTECAFCLLLQHNWSKEDLLEDYMIDSDKILRKNGVYHRVNGAASAAGKASKTCPICYDDDVDDMLHMPCGHAFCYDCWHDFASNAITNEGPSCVRTTCPQAGCLEMVTELEFSACLLPKSPDLFTKYQGYQLRSFVEANPLTRWCPGRGCDRVACAVSAAAMEDEGGKIATCDTCESTHFCLLCGEEPHAPCCCKNLAIWMEKCRNESETANWILANTKSCPKCMSRIEKNQGCNHMTCQRCRSEFCWICMGDWHDHGANTGGYYKCSRYQEDEKGGNGDSKAARAKRDLDRYLHFYRRFHAHQEAEKFAMKQLQETEQRMVLLQEAQGDAKWTDVEFLKTANEQLVECRRVLKYTYVFAYYLDPNRNMQRERFEHHQEMLERFTENLSELSEKPLAEMDRTQVVNQTRVVDRFMKNILKYVEEGMDE